MENPATKSRGELDDFTDTVRALAHGWSGGWKKTSYYVRLRNGTLVRPAFVPTEDETCEDTFIAGEGLYRWNLNGTSVTSRDYDMMEIIRND